jgi:hypothetical protein
LPQLIKFFAETTIIGAGSTTLRYKHKAIRRLENVAAHLLIPQLESSLRYLLIQWGVITSMLTGDMIQDEYPLTKIIYMPELNEILGKDLTFDLQGLLVDRHGFNVRNKIAHGMLSFDEFFYPEESYLWWATLRLCHMFKHVQDVRLKPIKNRLRIGIWKIEASELLI